MILENDILKLRAVEPEDATIMWEVESDSSQWIQNSMAAPLSSNIIYNYALSYDADPFSAGQLRLIVERKSDDGIIGIIDLYNISATHRNAFVAIYILPEFRRLGYAETAIGLLERYAFENLNLQHLAAKIMEGNDISVKLFCKCGYALRGIIPQWFQTGNIHKNLSIYSKILDSTVIFS